jgi:type II secretory pathway pseudopilin PulG
VRALCSMTSRPALPSPLHDVNRRRCAARDGVRRGHVLLELIISLTLLAIASVALSRVITSGTQQADRLTLVRDGTALVHESAEALAMNPCGVAVLGAVHGRVSLTPSAEALGPLRYQQFDVTRRASAAFGGRVRAAQATAAGWCP